MYNNLLYEIPESLGIHKHFKDINTFLKTLKDTENLSFSFENEETIVSSINALKKYINNSTMKKIIDRHGIDGIILPQDTFYCHSCCVEQPLSNKTNKTIPNTSGVLCTSCASYYYKVCYTCKKTFPSSELQVYSYKNYCKKCFDIVAFNCVYCGNSFPLEKKFSIIYNNKEVCYCNNHKIYCKPCGVCGETIPYGQYTNKTINGMTKPVCFNCQNNVNKIKAFSPTDEQIKKVDEELKLKPLKGIFDGDEVKEDYYDEYEEDEEEEN